MNSINIIVLVAILRSVSSIPVDGSCKLKDNSDGICKLGSECEYATEKNRAKKYDELIRCSFVKNEEVFCCPIGKSRITVDDLLEFKSKSEKYCDIIKSQPVNQIIPEIDHHIKNGTPAYKREFPHMVALGYNKVNDATATTSIEYLCGGTLLSRTFVLSAGHCFKRNLTKVLVGTIFTSGNTKNDELPQVIDIKKTIKFEAYRNSRKYDDIGLFELTRPVDVTNGFVRPSCLPTAGLKSPDNKYIIAGWGYVNETHNSNRLLKAHVTQLTESECTNKFAQAALYSKGEFDENVIASQFCAQNIDTNSDTCPGDSGGPAFFKADGAYFVYGVTSFGLGEPCKRTASAPGIYTFVQSYVEWIENTVWPEDDVNDY